MTTATTAHLNWPVVISPRVQRGFTTSCWQQWSVDVAWQDGRRGRLRGPEGAVQTLVLLWKIAQTQPLSVIAEA
ncbi:MAG: hypothetical protein ACI8PZ_005683 [Myxococcota bacterium]|jgi:hypothetical protein